MDTCVALYRVCGPPPLTIRKAPYIRPSIGWDANVLSGGRILSTNDALCVVFSSPISIVLYSSLKSRKSWKIQLYSLYTLPYTSQAESLQAQCFQACILVYIICDKSFIYPPAVLVAVGTQRYQKMRYNITTNHLNICIAQMSG